VKVREVEYSRLFNLENYQNERIGFRVEVGEDESADEVLGRLFFKVLQIEKGLQLYRDYCEAIDRARRRLKGIEREITNEYKNLAELENEKKRYLEEEEDTKTKMCKVLDIEELIDTTRKRIEKLKKSRDDTMTHLKLLEKRRSRLEGLIRDGKFDEIPSKVPGVEGDDYY